MARPRQQTPARPESEASFEQAMDELEGIVHALEEERLPLDQLVDRYERGMQLLKLCQGQLDVAKQRIELITVRAGKARLEPFAPLSIEADESEDAGGAVTDDAGTEPAASRPAASRSATTSSSRPDDDEIRLF